ncbi:MAG: LA_2272 family surface repeat-containing protein, partial [Polyangiaceae bacterium]
PRPSPCDAPGPFLPLGVDFLPYVGVSSADRGRSIRGFSLGALGDLSGGIHGFALAGVASVDTGELCGAQIGGVANVAGNVHGLQIAGVASVAEDTRGLQIAGVANVAGDPHGLQIAGVANIASGSMHGVQIGLVNYGRDADLQLGLVNINPGGRLAVDLWSKPETGLVLAGLKHGGAHYHWIYGIGTPVTDPSRPWASLGVGAHFTPFDNLYVDVDAIDYLQLVFRGGDPSELYEIRAVVGYRLMSHLSVFAGPSYTVGAQRTSASIGAPGYAQLLTTESNATYRSWPGIVLGIEGL